MGGILRALLDRDARWTQRLHIDAKPGLSRQAAILLAHSGDSWFWLLGLGLIWWFGDAFWRSFAGRMIIAILVTATLVMLLKFSIRRQRPQGDWGHLYRRRDPHSFPSGHAARMALIAVLSIAWAPPWLALPVALWAPLVAWARVAMGLHYVSDVFAGALLGGVLAAVRLVIIP